jgi:hypothetical protein
MALGRRQALPPASSSPKRVGSSVAHFASPILAGVRRELNARIVLRRNGRDSPNLAPRMVGTPARRSTSCSSRFFASPTRSPVTLSNRKRQWQVKGRRPFLAGSFKAARSNSLICLSEYMYGCASLVRYGNKPAVEHSRLILMHLD